jgi:hypothetical protein
MGVTLHVWALQGERLPGLRYTASWPGEYGLAGPSHIQGSETLSDSHVAGY